MSGISGRLRQINVSCDSHGRIEMDDDQSRHGLPPRVADIRAGIANIALGNILIFDFEGDSSKISKADNDRTDNVSIECKTVRGKGKESVTIFTIGNPGDGKWEKDGDAPFDGTREEKDASTHANLVHMNCNTNDGNMKCSWRQVRITKDGTFSSEWIGASDGLGFRVGRQ